MRCAPIALTGLLLSLIGCAEFPDTDVDGGIHVKVNDLALVNGTRPAGDGSIASVDDPSPSPDDPAGGSTPTDPAPGDPAAGDPALIQKSHMTYLGAFALPSGDYGTSRFGYSGMGLGFHRDPATGDATLFLQGHAWDPGHVAQVKVPATLSKSSSFGDLPVASVLQPFADITDGKLSSIGNYEAKVYGILPWEGRLIVGASEYYDADGSQVNSHGVSGFDLSAPNDFQGWLPMDGVANARGKGGYMTPIPEAWRAALGGPALTGNCCVPIISKTSAGPSVTVFDPAQVGTTSPIPATTVLFYPLENALGPPTGQSEVFNRSTQMGGVAFPKGSASVLFFGAHGTGEFCYGTGADCNDPVDTSKGNHAYPYRHQVWAYDVRDLVQVKEGKMKSWEVQPYAVWAVDDIDTSGGADIRGATFDPQENRLYVTTKFGEEGRVHVFGFSGF